MFAGVCGGIGEYFDIDVTLVRLIFVGLFFLGFPGILLVYLIMMVLVPQEPISDPVLPA
jgi:phage shock protein PspC (stress-responsive transcriptional regulator)